MAQSSGPDAATLISDWFNSLGLAETDLRVEQLEADYADVPCYRVFQFRPKRAGCFELDIIVSDDGYWGMGIKHQGHSETVYAWGFEGTTMSCEVVLQIARCIAEGQAEIVVNRFQLSKTVGFLELPQQRLRELLGLSRHDKIRQRRKTRFYQRRFRSLDWQ
ncbi:hypothetical protein ABMC89_02140 [Sulfitobacter sp. HNIBRBA3233]|uniref:hypothetical protein n=1 Tax=Sulfitobacter marinivivus TaxID=3158558 RepID=UPI0032DEC533